MPRVGFQFHVAPREAVSLGLRWAEQFAFRPVAEQFFPDYRAIELTGDAPSVQVEQLQRVDRLALCRQEPNVDATSAHDFVAKNADALFLSIGAQGGDGLRESALAGVTANEALAKEWRNLVRTAQAAMHSGATVRNPSTEAEQQLPKHLHTPGAHELAEQGVPMLAAAGWNEFLFDDCLDSGAEASAGERNGDG
jgi:hypothetical protein